MIAKDVLELRLRRPEGFHYRAGQFVRFHIPSDPAPVLRAYSIASTPGDAYLEFCMKILPGGRASAYFMNVTPETHIHFSGPQGRFICDTARESLSFVATGAGVAPIWGIIADELQNKKTSAPIRLLFGVRGEEDIFWEDRLARLAAAHPNFQYYLTLSQPASAWKGLHGRVTAHREMLPAEGKFFLCGNAEMVKDMRAAILAKNIPPEHIHFEIF